MKHTFADAIETDLQKSLERPTSLELRALYREADEKARATATRKGLWIAVLSYLGYSATDFLMIPDVAMQTAVARLLVSVLSLAVLELLIMLKVHARWLDRTSAVALVVAYAAWLVPALHTTHAESLSYYMIFGAIFMMGANLFFNFPFLLSIVSSGAILASFLASLIFFFPLDSAYAFAFTTFYLSCFVFTSYVNWKLNVERYHVFLNAHEAKLRQTEANERGVALLRMSNTDYLTGLDNRRAVDQRLRTYWNEWQGAGRGFAAMLVDVDFFKKYNDGYGHIQGDHCLITVANTIREAVEPLGGSIGRYGGEEFIVLARVDSRADVAALAEKIRATIESLGVPHVERRDGTAIVTVSVGAAFTRDHIGAKLEKMIHEADRALYSAKAHGRNCARVFDPSDPHTSDESENIAALLKLAINQNLVSMVYQPLVDLKTGRQDAAEALMRLKTLDGDNISPTLFIPIAERTGIILELGKWSIRTVCREMLVSNQADVVSVNVSPIQLRTPGFAASVAAILGETGVSGNRLAFEITEGLDMEIHSDVLRCISDLKTLGIRIWLDDFGTGFAGLSWLRLIDFDTVKIDRSFLHDIDTERGRIMLGDIVDLVRHRGPNILVEGVETEEQLQCLRDMNIDFAQGYHVGRPVAAARTAAVPRALSR
ncbi:EAL domain-containing protein [Neorhizobium sp. JUb45]|uniref:putative bifunctional diguanylate cyclase/phosphodiesterase n=1 Tax=unclassified Neorhizobium TaxID=2629175 RepID=UPI001045F60E|nr:EAL domain-containing protein [Neorhizobium sp. JUb45]TCR07351.1 diguanylate cyclase/phosphodiesterase [Neorhizobium sp. JUb45]